MRNYLQLILLLLAVNVYAQPAFDACADAQANTQSADDSFDETFTMSFPTDEGNFTNIGVAYNETGFITLNWSGTSGYYTIRLEGQGSLDYNFSYDEDGDCVIDGSADQLYEGSLGSQDIPCFYFENGTDYTFGFAADISGFEELRIRVLTEAPAYNVCDGALPMNFGTPIPATCELIFNMDAFFDETCPTSPLDPDYGAVSSCGDFVGNPDLWYEFTLADDADVNFIYTASGQADPNLSLFSGSCGGGLSLEDCTDGTTLDGSSNSIATFTSLTAGTQYYVLIESQGPMPGGGVSLIMSATPANNDCVDAEVLTQGSPLDGTNTCASATEFDYCTQSVGDDGHVVYYEYTVAAAAGTTTNLTVDISPNSNTSGTTIGAAEIDLFLNCGGAMAGYGTSAGDPCAALGGQVVYECVDGGTTLIIAVGSPNTDGGDFDITVDENDLGVPFNDNCVNADASVALLDCMPVELSGTTVNACPEGFTGPACAFDMQSVVWHEITLPGTATGVMISNITGGAAVTVFTDNVCPTPGMFFADSDCVTTEATVMGMTGGNSYLVGVSTDPSSEAAYTFDVLAIVPPANDLCADAEDITADAAAGAISNNNCASADGNVCGFDATTSHVTWYQYVVMATNNTDVVINVTGSGGAGVEALSGAFEVYTDCAYAQLDNSVDACANGFGTDTRYECVDGGSTIWIAVGSDLGEEGEFTITITEENEGPDNDECADADPIDLSATPCDILMVSGTNEFACPEGFTADGCAYDMDPVVWYTVTLPADAVGLEITDLTPGFYATYFTGACGALTFDGAAGCFTDMGNSQVTYSAGDEIFIGIGSATADEGMFSFNLLSVVPPANDMCANAEDITGSAAGGVAGTTACATPPAFDYCALGATSHVVYYSYTVMANNNTDLTIQIDGAGVSTTDVSVGLFEDCAGLLYNNMEIAGADGCTTLGTALNYECVSPGMTLIIAVGSPEGDEGEFTITVTEQNEGPDNDECADADPIDLSATPCEILTVSGTNEFACPEGFTADGCAYDMDPVVWYSVTLPADAVGLEITDLTAGFYATYFTGACGTLTFDGTAGCFTDEGNSGVTYNAGDVILVGIGSATADEGAFTFDILSVVPPANDICNPGAEDISATGAGGVIGTTACATPPANDFCSLGTTDSHVVYYEYTVASTKSTDLTIFIAGSGTVPATNVAVELYTDCVGTVYPNNVEVDGDDPCAAINTNLDYECVAPGTVLIIAVGSPEGNEGEFTITVTEDNSGVPDEDACANAIPINFTDCEFETINTPNVGACPETPQLDGVSACELDEDAVIWFEAPMPMGGIGFEFLDLTAGEYVAIFSGDCDNLVLEQDCVTADGQIVGLAENTTYYFAVAIAGQAEGLINFQVKTLTPADNDDPCMAEPLTSGTSVMGNNFCATEDFQDPNCAAAQGESSVWYSYTLGAGETGVEISFPSITAAGPINAWVVTLDPACTTPMQATPTSTTCDAGSLTEPLTLNCLAPGTELSIMVSSEADLAGEFEILLEVIVIDPTCIDNDECDVLGGGADQGEIVTDDDCTPVTDCNANACAEFIGDCGVEINNVVWYSVTNDGDGEFISASITNADFDTPVVAIFEGSCAALTQIGNCIVGGGNVANSGPLMIPAPAAGQQYWIAVGTQGAVGGSFDYCFEINSGCVNDDPCDAVELFDGMVVDNPASTVSCTPETANPDCSSGEVSSVWYSFVVPPGSGRFRVILSNVTIVGNVGMAIGPYSDAACAGLPAAVETSCEAGDQFLDLDCAPEGSEWFIQVTSGEDMDQGDFEIQIVAAPPTVDNDICSGMGPAHMIDITSDEYCQFIPVDVSTENACPEAIADAAGCDFTEGPAVWYEVTIPNEPGATLLDITTDLISGFAGNLQLAVVQVDCDDIFAGVAIDCQSVGNGEINLEDVPVTPGETYQIIIGSDLAGDEGEITMNIKVDVPPINDSPFADADNTGPWDLASGHTGTTCCAIGNTDDPAADWANLECGGASNENAVWYSFTPAGGADGFFVNVDPAGMAISGNMTVEVYSSTVAGGVGNPGNLTLIEASCTDLTVEIAVALCDPTLVYYVKVASTDGECGEFSISATEKDSDCTADECVDAEVLTTETPASCEDGETILSIEGCLDFACPEDVNIACMGDMGPTVWYQIDIDSPDATVLLTEVTADGFDVTWSIWQSTTGSCDDMINVSDPEPAPTPAIPCGVPGLDDVYLTIPIVQDPPGTPATYWVAITGLGEIEDPNFTLNYAGSLGCIACSGENAIDCGNGEWEAKIDGEVVEVEDFENFCPGQEVEVCLEFNYNTAGTGNDWLHGIIPTFGSGWDLENIDFEAIDLGAGWAWVDYEGPCATSTSIYTLPNLCTYTNDDGLLQLCNTVCNTSCPCTGPLTPNSPLPSGWFNNTAGGSTTCVGGSCVPLENFGVAGGVNVDVDVCFDLVVKAFTDEDGDGVPDEDCELNKDLQISIQTTSDAVSGCWEDNPCIIDPSITGPAWEINCDTPPEVLGLDTEICNTDMLAINVSSEDGSAVDIIVEVIDNPGVDGETDFMFTGGNGVIDNTLTNTSGVVETVFYEVYSVDPTKPCPGVTNTIEVIVYPQIEVTFNNPLVICDGDVIEVIATPTGGTGMGYQYQWGAPMFEQTPNIFVSPVTTTTYVVTVTDDLGCTGSSEVQVFWNPPVEFDLLPSADAVCQNDIEEELLSIEVEFTSGTGPFTINWDVDPGFNNLDYYLGNNANNNGVLTVYEETSTPGTYTVFVDVTDANGCENSEQIEITVGGKPFILVQDFEIPCGGVGGTVTIDAAGFFTSGPPVSMMELHTCDGIVIFDNNGSTASWTIDPNVYNCVVVVAIDQDGCEARTEDIELDLNAGAEPTLTGGSHCVGETSTVSVDDPALYSDFQWNVMPDPGSVATITADRDTNFIYVVTVTDAVTGCTGVESIEVEVDPNPTVSVAGILSYCAGSSTTLTASGGDSYSWMSGMTEISTTAEVVINTPGDYTVIVTNTAGCTSSSTVTVVEDLNLSVSLNTLSLCDGDTGTLSAGDSPGITYQWEDDAGTDLGTTFSIEVGGGTYCVTVTDTAAGCTGSTCTTITPSISPTVEVTELTDICRADVGLAPGVLLNFNDQVVGGVSGTWIDLDNPGVDLADLNAVDFTDVNLGEYRFEYRTNTAMDPCTNARDTMTVMVINCTCPSVAVLTDTLCNTQGVMFDLDELKNTNEDVTWTSTGANVVPVAGTMVDLSGLAAGAYEFTMTLVSPVGGTCAESNTAQFVIVEEAIAMAVDNTVCNANTGNGPTTIDLNTTLSTNTTAGGSWTDVNGDPVPDIFDGNLVAPGTEFVFTYTVPGTTPCGPVSTDVTIEVIDCNCPQVSITDPDAICNDSGIIDLDDYITTDEAGTWVYVIGGTTGPVVLEAGNVFNSNDGTTQLTSGLYTFNYVFDTDPGGDCPSEFPINIIVSNQPEVSSITASPCNVMSDVGSTVVDLTQLISGDVGNGVWSIEPGSEAIEDTNPDLINNVTSVNFDGLPINSVWEFTFTTAATAPCMPASTTVVVTVANCDCPNINVMEPAPVCNSETIPLDLTTLQDPMIGTGAWTVIDPLGANVILNGTELDLDLPAGDYMLTYTLDPVPATNCQPDSTVILSVSAQNFAVLGMDTDVCVSTGTENGANFLDFNTLVIDGEPNGVWTDTDGAGVDLTDYSNVSFVGVPGDMAFTFTYTIMSDAPCIPQSYTIEINTDPCLCPLAAPLDPSIECSDEGVVDLTQYNNATFPGTWSSTELTVTANSVDLTDVDAGVYVLMYTMDNPEEDCQDTWETSIEVSNPAFAGMPRDTVFCEDETEIVNLEELLMGEDAGGTWMETSSSTGGAFDPTGTFDIAGQAAGTYSFTYSIVGDAPCMDVSEMVEVVIEAVPNADAGMAPVLDCETTSGTIGGASSTGPNFTYLWTEAGGAEIADPTLAQITVTNAGVYTLVVTNTETMCTNTDNVTVTVSAEVPTFELDVQQISCNGAEDGMITIINPMGGNGDYTYSLNGGPFETTTSFTGLAQGTYTIVIEDSSGSGCDSEQSVTIVNPDLLVLDLGDPIQTNIGNEVSFSIDEFLGDFVIDNIEWTVDGEVICSDADCSAITIIADQNANVNVEVTYNGGCIATEFTQILVSQIVDVVLPNAFSPNNDGSNEVFYVNSDNVETVLSMRVYDRWGELVFLSENQPASDPTYGWNGTFKGEPLNPGVFVYVVEVLFVNGTTETIGGDVTIVK